MSNRLGMDAGLVRGYADQMDGLAEDLAAIASSVNGAVGRLSSVWLGADAQELAQRWQFRDRDGVAALEAHIRDLARSARLNAAEQDRASSATSSAGGGIGPDVRVFGTSTLFAVAGGLAFATGQALRTYERVHNGLGVQQSRAVGVERTFERSGSSSLGGLPASGTVSGYAYAHASEKSSAHLSLSGADASIAASAGVGVGVAASGMIGNRDVNVHGTVGADAMMRAEGDASVHAGRDGISAKAHGDAYAGVDAYASGTAEAGGVAATAGVHGYAGVGVHADADASLTAKEVKASVTLGAALGVGGGFTVSVDVKPEQVFHEISHVKLW